MNEASGNEINIYFRATDEKNQEAFSELSKEFKKIFPEYQIVVEEVKPRKKPAISAGPINALDPASLQVILDNPIFHFSLQIVLIKIGEKVFAGLLGKIGSDVWDKFRNVILRNKKDPKSFKKGVVLQIPIVISSKKTVETYFFLDSVPAEQFDEATQKAYQTLGKIVDIHGKENLEKIEKLGLFFNEGKWEIVEHENSK